MRIPLGMAPPPKLVSDNNGGMKIQAEPADLFMPTMLIVVGLPDHKGERQVFSSSELGNGSRIGNVVTSPSLGAALEYANLLHMHPMIVDPVTAINLGLATPEQLNLSDGVLALVNILKK